MSQIKDKLDASFVVLFLAFGLVIGGTLAVPLSAVLLNGFFSTFEVNGQIGDFVGGVLNPVIALVALIWLRRGVKIQEDELREARKSLVIAAESQGKQVQISAVTALLQVELLEATEIESRIKACIEELERLEAAIRDEHPQVKIMNAMQNKTSFNERSRARVNQEILGNREELSDLRARQRMYAKKLRELAPHFVGLPHASP